jgi:hypothetical protein
MERTSRPSCRLRSTAMPAPHRTGRSAPPVSLSPRRLDSLAPRRVAKRPGACPSSRCQSQACCNLTGVPRPAATAIRVRAQALECCRSGQDVDLRRQPHRRDRQGRQDRGPSSGCRQGGPGPLPRGDAGQHERDLRMGAGWVELPTALMRKYPNAGREWVCRVFRNPPLH